MPDDIRDKIKQLLPEHNLIKTETLRTQLISLWVDVVTRTGWGENLKKLPLGLDWPIEKFGNVIEHTRAVTRGVKALGEILEELYGIHIDYESLLTAALLHDLGKLEEFKMKGKEIIAVVNKGPGYHLKLGAKLAKEGGMSPTICHIIEVHSTIYSEKDPESVEAAILRFVDGACVIPLRFR